ncbi:MAG: fibronectin type III domain-containing protein, partial [Bacteroidota bacterium]
ATTGQKLYFSQFSTGKVRVVVQGLGYQTVDNTSTFLLYKTDLGTYRPEGDYETFTPADTTPPSVPTGLVSTGQTSTTITVDWVASTDNFGVTSYEVSRDDGTAIDTGSSLTGFTFVGLTASTAYDFRVRAKDAAGNVSAYTANINVSTTAPSSDPFVAASPVAYYSPASIDPSVTTEGNSVTVWNDEINAYNGTSAGGAAPTLNISPGGQRQVRFNGTDSWFNVGQIAAMNFQGGTDEFTIVVQLGENPGTQGSWFTKAGASSGSRQYTLYNPSTGDDVQYLVGGTGVSVDNNLSGGDLIILEVTTTDATLSINGVDVITGGAIGTATESQDINIGARTNGSFVLDGDATRIVIFDRPLTAQEHTDFQTYAANNQ